MVGLKNKILIILILLLTFTTVQSQSTASLALGIKSSVLTEFTTVRMRNKNVIYGGGISYFFDKGNKGKDYTGFVVNYSSAYETIHARNGSIYLLLGSKINTRVAWIMKFGMGVTTKYINGKGIINLPNELWYVRQKGYNEFLCGAALQFSSNISCIKIGWDSFNSFNLGIGININQNK